MDSFSIILPFPIGQVLFTSYLSSALVYTTLYLFQTLLRMTLSTHLSYFYLFYFYSVQAQPITVIFNPLSIGITQRALKK